MMAKAESAASKYTFSEMRKWSSRSSVFSVKLGGSSISSRSSSA